MKKIPLTLLLASLLVFAACTEVNGTDTQPHETAELTLAEEWVRDAPTYAYDGMNLTLVEYFVQETYPEQHVITFNFTSRQAGYGDRSDQMTAQVITDHQIRVVVVESEVVSAHIDGAWNELTQQPITNSQNTSDDRDQGAETMFMFQPMQCEEYAWNDWYADNQEQYIEEPGVAQLVNDYYLQAHNTSVDVQRVNMPEDQAVCQACNICPAGYHLELTAEPEANTSLFEADGWE